MSGPWEMYKQPDTQQNGAQTEGPWNKYKAPEAAPTIKKSQISVDSALPTTLNVAGFDTGIPLNKAVSKALVMLGQGSDDAVHGVRQRYNELVGDTVTAKRLEEETAGNRAAFQPMREEHPIASALLGGLGHAGMTAPLMWFPGGGSASALTRLGNAFAQGATIGYLSPTAKDESVLANTLVGGGVGAGISGLMSAGGKVVNAIRGNFAAPKSTGGAGVPPPTLYDLSKRFDVPLTAGETLQSPALKRTEVILENVPVVGTGRFRTKQANATLEAAKRAVESARPVGVQDAGEEIHAGLRRVLSANRATAKTLYDDVANAAMTPGVTAVRPVETRSAAIDLLKDYPDIFDRLPAGTVKSKLEAIVGATNPTKSAVLGPTGAPFIKPAELTFDEARFLRKQLSNYIDRAARSAGAVGSDEMRQLTVLKAALEKDIEKWGMSQAQNADVKQAFNIANSFYKDSVAPFKDTLLNKATGKDFDTDTIFKTFVRPGREKLAEKLVSNLDNTSHQAVKFGVLKSAFDRALDEKTGVFSPLRFASEIDKLSQANNAIFAPAERTQLNGLVKVMTAAQRAGQYMENPPTGNRIMQAALGLGAAPLAYSDPLLALGSASGAKALTTLTTTDAGKRLLMAASKLPFDSPKWESLLTRSVVPMLVANQNAGE